jgi:hypothetical protein
MSSAPLIGKTASGGFCSHEQQVHALQAKIASLEREKEEAYKKGEVEQITKSNREAIASIIPRDLPQYREDQDFQKEVEYRVNQLNEYTTIEDLKELYEGKVLKHAKGLEAKTASSIEGSSNRFSSLIQNPLNNIVGNNLIHTRGGTNNGHRVATYDPLARQYYNNSRGRTASATNNSLWYLDLFDPSNFSGS